MTGQAMLVALLGFTLIILSVHEYWAPELTALV